MGDEKTTSGLEVLHDELVCLTVTPNLRVHPQRAVYVRKIYAPFVLGRIQTPEAEFSVSGLLET